MDELTSDMATLMLRLGGPFLKTHPDGKIFSANIEFCNLVEYSEMELKRLGWKKISVQNEEFEADLQLAAELEKGTIQDYKQWKSYTTRNGNSVPGQLTVIRYPQGTGPIECCLCSFSPLVNGHKASLATVTEYLRVHAEATKENAKVLSTMVALINGKPGRTKLRAVGDSILDWADENPKFALVILVALLSGLMDTRGFARKIAENQGWIQPQKVQIEVKDPETGDYRPATGKQLEKASEIPYPVVFTITTSKGNVATFRGNQNAGLSGFDRSVGGSDRQSRSLPGGDGRDHSLPAIPGGWLEWDRGFSLLPGVSVRGPTGDDGIRTLARESF